MRESLGKFLLRIRKERKLTLRDVEREIGISNAYLSQLETEKIEQPSPKILHKLSNLYGISYEKLLNLTGYPLPESSSTRIQNRIQTEFSELSSEEKEQVSDYIQYLKSKRKK